MRPARPSPLAALLGGRRPRNRRDTRAAAARRLQNKAEVLTFKVRAPDGGAVPVAIAQSRLTRQPVTPWRPLDGASSRAFWFGWRAEYPETLLVQ